MIKREVFTQAINEMDLYMSWYYEKIGVPKEDIQQMIYDRGNRLIAMWLESEEHTNGETFTREELTKWLLTFVHKNSVLGKQCERLIKKLDDFETFVADMRGEE